MTNTPRLFSRWLFRLGFWKPGPGAEPWIRHELSSEGALRRFVIAEAVVWIVASAILFALSAGSFTALGDPAVFAVVAATGLVPFGLPGLLVRPRLARLEARFDV